MKTYNILLIATFVFMLLLGGAFTLQVQADIITATAKCTPPLISLSGPGPNQFRITLELPKPYEAEDIDPNTIWVGGIYQIMPKTNWPKIKKNFFAFKVDGWCMINWIVTPRIWHMHPPSGTKVDIPITVTGQLYSGKAFQGVFTLTVLTQHKENHLSLY